MKTILLASGLILVLLISGCISAKDTTAASFDSSKTVVESSDLLINIESTHDEIKPGRQMVLSFDLQNKLNNMSDISVVAYDQCMFTGDENSFNLEFLQENKAKIWTWKWVAGNTEIPVECKIKFRTMYETNFTIVKEIISLQEAEYYSRDERGSLNEIIPTTSITENPILVEISFSEEQPFIEGEEYNMYIDYSYSGSGIIDELTEVEIIMPDFMEEVTCAGYEFDEDTRMMTLKKPLGFVKKQAAGTTCKFKTELESPIQIERVSLTASYIYKFDNSLLINIRP